MSNVRKKERTSGEISRDIKRLLSGLTSGLGFVLGVDYQKIPCACGHAFSRHRKISGGCRDAKCRCRRFVNSEYVLWLIGSVSGQLDDLVSVRNDFLVRVTNLRRKK